MELKTAVNSIPKDSRPGPDGFGLGFYKSCWDFTKEDLLKAIKECFSGAPLPIFFTSF